MQKSKEKKKKEEEEERICVKLGFMAQPINKLRN
jgi:hypothetical protein